MLHARLHGRQARAMLLAVVLATGAALLTPPATVAADDSTASAETLARSGQHAEAARSYEQQAKRLFRAWDTRLTLLAAREYLAAGQTADAERMLGKVGGRASGDDAILLARIQAELALANGNGAAATGSAGQHPEAVARPARDGAAAARGTGGLPVRSHARRYPRARAARQAPRRDGRAGRELSTAARCAAAQWRHQPPSRPARPTAIAPGSSWHNFAQRTRPATRRQRVAPADWSARHPNHPGTSLLPRAAPGTAASAGLPAPALMPGQPPSVALLLPLSGRQQAAGTAVRDGFLAAYLDRPDAAPRVLVYDTAELGVGPAYERALADGAQFVIGPLTKDDVATLAAGQLAVPTLALNSFSGESPPPFPFPVLARSGAGSPRGGAAHCG